MRQRSQRELVMCANFHTLSDPAILARAETTETTCLAHQTDYGACQGSTRTMPRFSNDGRCAWRGLCLARGGDAGDLDVTPSRYCQIVETLVAQSAEQQKRDW
jgi:hypothetical protein